MFKKRSSPRGLMTSRTEPGPTFNLMTEEGRKDFQDAAQNPLMSFTLTAGSQGEEVIAFGPNWLEMCRRNLAAFEEIARSEGAQENWRLNPAMRDSGQLDRVLLASEMLENALSAKRVLERLVGENDRERAKLLAYQAVYELTALAANYHAWTVVDNEPSIVARNQSIEGARQGGLKKAQSKRGRDLEIARQFEAQRGGKLSDTALKQKIGRKYGLGRTAVSDAIRRAQKSGRRAGQTDR
ncbi:hypothetical protein HAP41_0000048870 (plasmid) [Bradyrhizobium barranii subsp. apii]|uniref:Uncharacterized protein n=1 Tax=Bradyrhizobium barranii subsp. apii TaxID=2819348 RepID=A0A8T5VT25_9BRAD|nr:hypothetical protein [Bradyrhizobium barranii]UPT92182.1 hypothetical protein HAP41_0000048870 [Bradyrhizobium barranii subsp. apii]